MSSTRYRAIPLIVYVPLTDNEEDDELRAAEAARTDPDLRVFLAEDYKNGIAEETEGEELSASIGTACDHI
jgi:hypothetical protein